MSTGAPQQNPFARLLAVAREVSFLKGAELVRQGESSRGCFLIRAGSVEARVALPGGGSLAVAQFRDGDMFGEMALIERGVVSATVVAQSNVDAWFVARDDFRALVASREIAALETQRAITRTLSDKLRVLNERIRAYPAVEDRPATGPVPAADPLAGIARSRRASFDWRSFLPVLPFFEGFDEDEMDELAAAGKVLELPRGAWAFVAIAGPGELVGFMALINAAPRANSARARSLLPAGNSARRVPRNLQRRLGRHRQRAARHPPQPDAFHRAHQHPAHPAHHARPPGRVGNAGRRPRSGIARADVAGGNLGQIPPYFGR